MRVGLGYDIHRLIPTLEKSSIPLGGISVPCFFRIEAHSDGDVVLHALVDACLGALALGDIGQWFPDTSEENRNRKSADFVREVVRHVKKMGWQLGNIDATIFAEEPKIGPQSDSIRREIASLLGLELTSVSLKAKTMEGLGPVGERRAISAQVIVALNRI